MITKSKPSTENRSHRFLATSWTMVLAAGGNGDVDDAHRSEALAKLLEQYTPAVKQYLVTRFGFDKEDVEDLTQGFVLDKVLKRDLLQRARKDKGKFRTFLLTAVNHYVFDHLRAKKAAKRIPEDRLVAIETEAILAELGCHESGADVFDLAFVRQVLAEALHRCHQHCQKRGMADVWKIFSQRILAPAFDGTPATGFEQLSEELGLGSTEQAHNRLVTAKRIFKRELRTVVLDYSESNSEVTEELEMFHKLLDGD